MTKTEHVCKTCGAAITAPEQWDGDKVKDRRVAAGLSKAVVGRAVGCSGEYVAAWESGKRPIPPKFWAGLSEVLS